MATLQDAAAVASRRVQKKFEAGLSLRAAMTAWLADIVAALNTPTGAYDPDSIAQRTVANQVPIGREILEMLPTNPLNQNQLDANIVSVYVYRVCKAGSLAVAGDRISAAAGAVLDARFQVTWPP